MAPDDGHGRSHTAHATEYAVQMANVVSRLEAIHSEVTRLADHIATQNSRVHTVEESIGDIEKKCVAHDSMAVTLSKSEIRSEGNIRDIDARVRDLETYRDESVGAGVSDRLDDMEARVKDLEGFKHEAGGAVKATIGIVRDAMMIFTFLLSAWYMVGERMTHSHEPAPQHQAK